MRYALALMVVSALAATAGLARGESPRAPELVYASVRLLNEEGGSRVDRVADLFALRVNGTGLRRLTRTVDWEDAPAWSHDGSRIAYGRGLPACHANTCNGALEASIWLANGDGSRPRRLSNGLARRLLDGSPAWSPDDRQVAFTRKHCCDTSPEDGVYVVSSAGSGLRRLVTMRAEAVDWAPDGRRLAVAAHRGAPVLLVDVSTGEVTPLSVVGLPSPVSDVAWAPDGKRFVAATKRGVFVVSSTGGRARRLSGALPVGNVAWSPDGGRLAFSSQRTAPGLRSDVYVMASDGTALKRLTGNPGFDLAPSWRP